MNDEDMKLTEPTQPTSEEIVEALRAAGWLLEQETDTTLQTEGYHTAMGFAFPDPDDSTISREIDIVGYRQLYRNEELGMSVGIRIIVECKQSSMPYVLIGKSGSTLASRSRKSHQLRFDTVETGRTPLGNNRFSIQTADARDYIGLRNLPENPWDVEFIATQMTRLDRKKTWLADNKGIFTSLVYPIAKALTHFKSQNKRGSYAAHQPGRDWASIIFYYPIITTSAPIYIVDHGRNPLSPKRVPWTTMTRQIKARNIDEQLFVDVVSANSLHHYLTEHIEIFAHAVQDLATNYPKRFIAHEDHTYQGRATINQQN